MEGPADEMKPDCNKSGDFNCGLNFQCYLCLEVGLLTRRYVSYRGNFSFADGDHVLAAKHVQKTVLFGLELFGVAGGRSMVCRRWTGKKKSYQISQRNKKIRVTPGATRFSE